jgi:hypothetical protein
MVRLAELKKLQPWLVLSRSVRAEVQSDEEDFRPDAAEQWGAALAANGFPIDPQAPLGLRLRFQPTNVVIVGVGKAISATTVMNTSAAQAYARASVKLDLITADGKLLWTGGEITGEAPIGTETLEETLRKQWPEVPNYTSVGPPGFDIRPRYPKESLAARDVLMKKLASSWPKLFPEGRVPDALVIDPTQLDPANRPIRLPLYDQATLDVLAEKADAEAR